jgi:hypothetical protein
MAVSADPSILDTVDMNAYDWGAPAHKLRQMSLDAATLNLANSPATLELEKRVVALKKNQERPASWAEEMIKSAHTATEPSSVRMVIFEPNAEVYLQVDWTAESHGLLNLGDRSTVFGFTTDLPPTTVRGSGIATPEGRADLIPTLASLTGDYGAPGPAAESTVIGMGKKPAAAVASLLDRRAAFLPLLINLMGQGIDQAAGEEFVLAQGMGGGGVAPGTVVGPSPQATSFAPTVSPGSFGNAMPGAGGAGAGLPFGGAGGIGTAPTPFFGGGGTGSGGGNGSGAGTRTSTQASTQATTQQTSQIPTITINTNISLQNQQSQSQAQAQAQSQNQSESQSETQTTTTSTNVVPEPWALLSGAMGLPVLFYLIRRRRRLAPSAATV